MPSQEIPPLRLAFVDLETTGANFANDRIIEVGLVEVDLHAGEPPKVCEWNSLVDPGRPVPPFIRQLTGIRSDMVDGAPAFSRLAPGLLERLRGRLFVAHNARFDYGFLRHEFKRLDIDFRATSLCTVKLSRRLFPGHARHNLDTLTERYGIVIGGDRHRALADARILWDLWQRWHELLPAETIDAAVVHITGRPELPPQLDPAILDDLPEAPGAYALYGENGELLAAKRADNLRQQVFAQFSPARRNSVLARETWRIEWRETAGELGARLAEIAFAPDRLPEDLCAWQLHDLGGGDFRPQLVFAHALDFADSPNLYGLYATQREATQALRKLADAHHLCYELLGLGHGRAGEACAGYRQRACHGACIGKESHAVHGARLLSALAKIRVQRWSYAGPIAVIERDEFGMREDAHIIDGWRHLGTVHDEAALQDLCAVPPSRSRPPFHPEIYRTLGKCLASGKHRIVVLPAPARATGINVQADD